MGTRNKLYIKQLVLNRIIPALFVVVGILAILETTHTIDLYKKPIPKSRQIVTVGTPPKTETPATTTPVTTTSTPTPTTAEKPTPTSGSLATSQGTAKDTMGQSNVTTDSSKWISSATGNITVKQPVGDQRLLSGATIAGSAKVDQVNYRLIDNKVGLIAQGLLSVVNGNFSGELKFTTSGTAGRLDVYSLDAAGAEINEIQINLSL